MAEGRWQYNGLRYGALRERLISEVPTQSKTPEVGQPCPTIRHLIAACSTESASNAFSPSTLHHGSNGTTQPKRNGCLSHNASQSVQPLSEGSTFLGALDGELGRVRRCVAGFAEELWMRLLDVVPQLPPLPEVLPTNLGYESKQDPLPLPASVQEVVEELLSCCNILGEDLVHLESFIQVNTAAAAYLAEVRDGCKNGTFAPAAKLPAGEGAVQPLYLAVVHECIVGDVQLDAVLVGLGDLYEHLRTLLPEPELETDEDLEGASPRTVVAEAERARQEAVADCNGNGETNGVWVPPDIFERKSTKFWVKPALVSQVQAEIVKHLPVLVFGREAAQKLTAGAGQTAQLHSLHQQTVQASSRISSVYLDNPQSLSTYWDRLHREHNAAVVRLRWYGARRDDPHQIIWAERKIHRERWTGQRSIKERASMEQQHMKAFLDGTGGPPEMQEQDRKGGLLRDMQNFITSRNQKPHLRTSCSRTAFQKSDNNAVRISLDSGLAFTREGTVQHISGMNWCRDDLLSPPTEKDVVRFPYAVLELKLSCGSCPPWITNLVAAGVILEVPMFSKFLHGTAILNPESCMEVPYWFLPDEGRRLTPATYDEMADTTDEYLKGASSWVFPKGFAAEPRSRSSGSRRDRLRSFFNLAGDASAPIMACAATPAAASKVSRVPALDSFQRSTHHQTASDAPVLPVKFNGYMPGADVGIGRGKGQPQGFSPAVPAVLKAPNGSIGGGISHGSPSQGYGAGLYPEQHVSGLDSGLFTVQAVAAAQQLTAARQNEGQHVQAVGTQPQGTGLLGNGASLNDTVHEQGINMNGAPNGDVMVDIPPAASHPECVPPAIVPDLAKRTSSRVSFFSSYNPEGSHTTAQLHGDLSCRVTPVDPTGVPLAKGEDKIKRPLRSKLADWILGGKPLGHEDANAAVTGAKGNGGGEEPDGSSGEGAPRKGLLRWIPKSPRSAGSQRVKALVRSRVEPKVFFANERTFLSWLHISVLIMFMALSLLGGSTLSSSASSSSGGGCAPTDSGCKASKIAGLVIAPVAFVFVIYALFMYKKRTYQILRREKVRYDDQRGPVLLVILLASALIVATVITANSAFGNHSTVVNEGHGR